MSRRFTYTIAEWLCGGIDRYGYISALGSSDFDPNFPALHSEIASTQAVISGTKECEGDSIQNLEKSSRPPSHSSLSRNHKSIGSTDRSLGGGTGGPEEGGE